MAVDSITTRSERGSLGKTEQPRVAKDTNREKMEKKIRLFFEFELKEAIKKGLEKARTRVKFEDVEVKTAFVHGVRMFVVIMVVYFIVLTIIYIAAMAN